MGALPKRRISTHRKGKRRLNHKVDLVNLTVCSQCGSKRRSHQVCPQCGAYQSQTS